MKVPLFDLSKPRNYRLVNSTLSVVCLSQDNKMNPSVRDGVRREGQV